MAYNYTKTPSPFSQQNPQGTHFSDGCRVGQIFYPEYEKGVAGGNNSVPTLVRDISSKLEGNGVLLGPEIIYQITPRAALNNGLTPDGGFQNDVLAANFIPLALSTVATTNGGIFKVNLNFSVNIIGTVFNSCFLLDVPRCISLTAPDGKTIAASGIFVAYGIDQYGFYVYSKIVIPAGGLIKRTIVFPKAMKALFGIYTVSGLIKDAIVGWSDVYGLPYALWKSSSTISTWVSNIVSDDSTVDILEDDTSNIEGALPDTLGKFPLVKGDPLPIPATGVSTPTSLDVRGLVIIPGYFRGGGAPDVALPKSDYTDGLVGGFYAAKSLTVRLFVPGAMSTTQAFKKGSAVPAEDGKMVFVEPWDGAGKCVPLQIPPTARDLYGAPQFWDSINVPT